MDQITDRLWISDIDTVAESSTQRFDLVVSTCQDVVRENVGCQYMHFPLADDAQSACNWGGTTDYTTFESAAWAVIWALHGGATVLVHCHSGRNRSVSVSIAALALRNGWTYGEAFERVLEARPIASPDALMEQHARRFVVTSRGDSRFEVSEKLEEIEKHGE
jgi:protein-tyrosine phosphatase